MVRVRLGAAKYIIGMKLLTKIQNTRFFLMNLYSILHQYIKLYIIPHMAPLGQQKGGQRGRNVCQHWYMFKKNNPHIQKKIISLWKYSEHVSVSLVLDLDLGECICPLSPTVLTGLSDTLELKGTLLGLWHHIENPAKDLITAFSVFHYTFTGWYTHTDVPLIIYRGIGLASLRQD